MQVEAAALDATTLVSLNDDSLSIILSCCEESDVLAAAACCTRLQSVCSGEALWQQLVAARWPHLPAAEIMATESWRDFYRERAATIPNWRYFLVRMDEVEHFLRQLVAGANPEGCVAIGNQIAASLVAIFCTSELVRYRPPGSPDCVLGYSCGKRWARRLCQLLCMPAACDALIRWTSVILERLDDFYESCQSHGQLQATLLRSLHCASALTVLKDDIGAFITPADAASEEERFAFQRAVSPARVAEALQSLEMEGFDVSVPASLRPTRLSHPGHVWWRAQTRQGYLGGVTNIR